LLEQALGQANEYERQAEEALSAEEDIMPSELQGKITHYYINEAFKDEVRELLLPQFVVDSPRSLFPESETALLTPERLNEGFRLTSKDIEIDFSTVDAEIARIDIEGSKDAIPKAWKLSGDDSEFFKKWFESRSPDKRTNYCIEIIINKLSKKNAVNDRDLRDYVERVVGELSPDQLADLQQTPLTYATKIDRKIEMLLTAHRQDVFDLWLKQGKIRCQPSYRFAEPISPINVTTTLPKTLYTAEEEMNGLERDVAWQLANMESIKWWHRNISRRGFAINGYVTAYPDIIAMTHSGKVLMVEPKGDHLENSESRTKATIGSKWAQSAGGQYKYYMVFRNKRLDVDGAVHFDKFAEIAKEL
jgi:type III restriction enzyme